MPKTVKLMDPITEATGKIAPSSARRGRGGWKAFFGFRTIKRTMAGILDNPKIVMALYSRVRSTPYTASELAAYDKFASVNRSVANVMRNPTLLNTALIEFKAQTTYKTLRNYVWHREWDNYQG